jgi:hypothetical protein
MLMAKKIRPKKSSQIKKNPKINKGIFSFQLTQIFNKFFFQANKINIFMFLL